MSATPRWVDFSDDRSDEFSARMGESFRSIARNRGREQREEQGVGKRIEDASIIDRLSRLMRRP